MSVTIRVPHSLSVVPPEVKIDCTPQTVPQSIKDQIIKNGVLYVDVVNAGAKISTDLTDEQATDEGLIKNHWTFRALIDVGQQGQARQGQVRFGMEVSPKDVRSDQALYVRTPGRSDTGTGSMMSFSSIGDFNKPRALASDEGAPDALPLISASGDGSHNSYDPEPDAYSDIGSVGKPPNITTSSGLLFQQPTEGAPYPGVFNIKIRSRTEPSRSIVVVFQLQLAPGTTFGGLIDALSGMEPFHFRKLGVAFLGCRDFISQATAKWLKAGLLVSGMAQVALGSPDMDAASQAEDGNPADAMHIFKLLGWRYTNPLVPVDDADPSGGTVRGAIRRRNLIDRAVWPENFVHDEDAMLKYNQLIDVAAT